MAVDVREKLADMLFAEVYSGGIICDGDTYKQVRDGFIKIADRLIAHGVTLQEWISVKDRLPDESGKYIVCCDDSGCSYGEGIWYRSGVVVIADVDVGIYGGICWEWDENGTIYDLEGVVTHWMPLHLPKLPKGE